VQDYDRKRKNMSEPNGAAENIPMLFATLESALVLHAAGDEIQWRSRSETIRDCLRILETRFGITEDILRYGFVDELMMALLNQN